MKCTYECPVKICCNEKLLSELCSFTSEQNQDLSQAKQTSSHSSFIALMRYESWEI